MYYEETSLQGIVEVMNSCDRLGLMYVLQKEVGTRDKWFGLMKEPQVVYKLQVVQYTDEEVEENENDNLQGRQSNSEEECEGEMGEN
jgi:hypothetical protein